MDIGQPDLLLLICQFLARITGPHPNASESDRSEISLPTFLDKISVYKSAIASLYVPSDICGIKGMCCEWIHATPSWWKGAPRYDTILVETDPDYDSMQGTDVAQVKLFLSLHYNGTEYCCALVDWFSRIGDNPDEDTSLQVVEQDCDANGHQILQVIDIDTIIWCAHLIGVYRPDPVNTELKFRDSLYAFHTYYVNKYADHHSFEVAF